MGGRKEGEKRIASPRCFNLAGKRHKKKKMSYEKKGFQKRVSHCAFCFLFWFFFSFFFFFHENGGWGFEESQWCSQMGCEVVLFLLLHDSSLVITSFFFSGSVVLTLLLRWDLFLKFMVLGSILR